MDAAADSEATRHDQLFQQVVSASGLVSQEQLGFAQDIQQSLAQADSLLPLGVVLMRRGYLTISQASHVLREQPERLLYCHDCQGWRFEEVEELSVEAIACSECGMDLSISPEDLLLSDEEEAEPVSAGSEREDALVGATVEGYVVEERVSSGRYEGWYRAVDAVMGKTLMLHAIPPQFRRSKDMFTRLREDFYRVKLVDAAAKPDSFDLVQLQNNFYVTQTPLEGRSVVDLAASGPVPFEEVVKVMIPVAELAVAGHRQDLIDFDFTPDMIVVDDYGRVKCMDVSTGFLHREDVDAVRWRAPERIVRKPINEPADIFSFHAICYLLLVGKAPFEGDDVMDVTESVMHGRFIDLKQALPDLEEAMLELVQKGMALAPSARPQDFKEVLDYLRHIPEMIRAREKEKQRALSERQTRVINTGDRATADAPGRRTTGRITVASLRDRLGTSGGTRVTQRIQAPPSPADDPAPIGAESLPEVAEEEGAPDESPVLQERRQMIAEYGRRAREFMKLKRYTLAIKALNRILEYQDESREFETEIANARKAIKMLEQHKNK